jgi:transposase-like protein
MEAYLHGVSTRKVDTWCKRLMPTTAASASPRSAGSAPDPAIEVSAFRGRLLAGLVFPHVFVDATVRHEAQWDRAGCEGLPALCRHEA